MDHGHTGQGYAERVAAAQGRVEGPAVKALNLNPPFWDHPVPPGARPTRVPMQHMPQLSRKERDRRWDGLRKRMLMANVDALLFLGNDIYWDMGLANLRYVTNAATKIATHALFFMDRDPIVYNNVGHMNRPYNYLLSVQDWVDDIRPFRGLPEIAAELKDLGYGQCCSLKNFMMKLEHYPRLNFQCFGASGGAYVNRIFA